MVHSLTRRHKPEMMLWPSTSSRDLPTLDTPPVAVDNASVANSEQLAILKQGVEAWNLWREEHPKCRLDLHRAALYGAELSKAQLSNADLTKAGLVLAILTEATLTNMPEERFHVPR